ncbi:prepilin peptidase [Schaalia suimastitidis]|uniref:prepilin peptidase n=1 Tax=Schaalia suimastitidis TaxID=121163 RepID=UPI000422624E|nr:A24 family peptidase [Schaalia suimastitidis]
MFEAIRTFLHSIEELRLIAGFTTWLLLSWWVWARGWRIQRRYLVAVGMTPLARNGIWWAVTLLGAAVVIAGEQRPAAPALVTVAMVGALSAYVDVKTHRLPNAYTAVMGCGVATGVLLAALMDPSPGRILFKALTGAIIWTAPLWLASRLPGGMGRGDVKLAPVLGAMLGILGLDAALFGLVVSFVTAGLAALWKVVVGHAGTESRIPMGPWLIGGALASHLAWGVLPDWI